MNTTLLLLTCSVVAAAEPAPGPHEALNTDDLAYTIDLEVITQEFDGAWNWFQARGGAIPASATAQREPVVVFTMQKWFVGVSDFFSGLGYLTYSPARGSGAEIAFPDSLSSREETGDIEASICDVTLGWHPPTKTLLALGHTVRYRDNRLMRNLQPRETAYSVYDVERNVWSDWDTVDMPNEPSFFNVGNGGGQWLIGDDGDLLVPIYYRTKGTENYAATVMRCRFDGATLAYESHGTPLQHDQQRGVYEPSLTHFQDRYYLTMRGIDGAYVATSGPDLNFAEKRLWRYDDGEALDSENTKAYWVTHHDALFLVYNRKSDKKYYVVRQQAPICMTQVDPERRCLIRETEQVLVPEREAMMGSFGVVNVSPDETWVTAGEGLEAEGSDVERVGKGRIWASRILWSRPNELRLP